MKVICSDNYDRDWVADRLVRTGLSKEDAERLAASLNAKISPDGPDFYRAVPDEYALKTMEP